MVLLKPSYISPSALPTVPVSGFSLGNNSISNVAPSTISTEPSLITTSTTSKQPIVSLPIESKTVTISPYKQQNQPPISPPTSSSNNTLLYALLGIGSLAAVSAGIYVYMKRSGK